METLDIGELEDPWIEGVMQETEPWEAGDLESRLCEGGAEPIEPLKVGAIESRSIEGGTLGTLGLLEAWEFSENADDAREIGIAVALSVVVG